jgi:hypothetical protein
MAPNGTVLVSATGVSMARVQLMSLLMIGGAAMEPCHHR